MALNSDSGFPQVSINGEVVFESVHHNVNKKIFQEIARKAIGRRLREIPEAAQWANYRAILSPGKCYDEVRCQIDLETSSGYCGFAIGFGQRPNHAFNDALGRMQWIEKTKPLKLVS
jgi:hypothetical protein